MNFTFTKHSQLPDILLVDGLKKFEDYRGFFFESFRVDEFLSQGIPPFVQENHSYSVANTLRGMHYQLNPKAQGKLVYCVSGSILDVVVDIRKESPTYRKSISVSLGAHFPRMIYIPPGYAHGFLVDNIYPFSAEVVYKTTEYFYPEYDRCVRWDDPDINISWGLMAGDRGKLKISYKDMNAPLLKDAENNFLY
ncbi:MAG: dTDP-4-dehydrorhamnose 3,5-epimerase [Patescibacteria group bacterium]